MAVFKNMLSDVKHDIGKFMYKKQNSDISKIVGKVAYRYGKIIRIDKANKSKVAFTNVSTGSSSNISTRSFLSRAVIILDIPDEFTKKMDGIPIGDRAYNIASSSSLSTDIKILWIRNMSRNATGDDKDACDWYIDQLKSGSWPIRRYRG